MDDGAGGKAIGKKEKSSLSYVRSVSLSIAFRHLPYLTYMCPQPATTGDKEIDDR